MLKTKVGIKSIKRIKKSIKLREYSFEQNHQHLLPLLKTRINEKDDSFQINRKESFSQQILKNCGNRTTTDQKRLH